jgi:hypothetical protein
MDPEEGEEFETEDFDELEDDGHPPEDQREDEDQPPEEEGLEDEPPARKPSRAQTRIEALDRTAREAIERAEAAERRVNEILNGNTRAEAERRERELIERMDPDERREHEARLRDQRTTHEIGSLRAQIADSTDRAKFGSACATNATLAKVRDQVEVELSKLQANGQTVPRSTLAAYLIGQQVLEKAPKARERAAKKAAANLDRERARPARGASDAPRGRDKDEKAARDKRLENYTF